jgi:hypothetical protein
MSRPPPQRRPGDTYAVVDNGTLYRYSTTAAEAGALQKAASTNGNVNGHGLSVGGRLRG